MMKSFRFRLLIAAVAVLLGSTLAKSQTPDDAPPPPPMHHGFGMGDHMGFFARELNLTDDQKTQMKAIMKKEHPSMKPLLEQQHQIDLQLRQYVEGSFDQVKVQALAKQKAKIQSQLTVAETRVHNQLYQILTSDQKSQLKQLETEHEARMQHEPPPPPEE
jgi:Spy/CpxP family protein refolding chaperone